MYLPHGRATTKRTQAKKFFMMKAQNGFFSYEKSDIDIEA